MTYLRLNDAQRQAITFEGPGPLLVLAGPGSGKTFVITQRIRYLTEVKKISPEKILVLTFTRDAAAAMKERFLRFSTNTVNFGTFHSIFYQVLKQSTHFNDSQLLTDMDKKGILLPVLGRILPSALTYERNNLALEIISAIGYYKNSSKKEEATRRLSPEIKELFDELFTTYETERRKQGKLDFDDMLTDCRRLLSENLDLRRFWQNKFEYLLIDEFQDVNPAQYEVIRLLSKEPYPIFAVGDDDQSIYGFRGADPSCMQRFQREYQADMVTLSVNYRSNSKIVNASMKLIKNNQNRFEKELVSSKEQLGEQTGDQNGNREIDFRQGNSLKESGLKEVGCIIKRGFRTKEEELEYLKETCKSFLLQNDEMEGGKDCTKEDENVSSLAILFRTNRLMQRLAMRLRQEKIPFAMREKEKDASHGEVPMDVMAYLKMALGIATPEDVARVINKPSRFVSREALSACRENGMTLEKYYSTRNLETAERLRLLNGQLERIAKLSPFTAVQYLRKVVGYEKCLFDKYANDAESLEDAKEMLEWVTKEASKQESILEWVKTWGQGTAKVMKEDDSRIKVFLMTAHASKGLEFDKVILPSCNERVYPHGTMLDQATLEEERRVFYVGMTRARQELEFTYIKGEIGEAGDVSRFLGEIFKN